MPNNNKRLTKAEYYKDVIYLTVRTYERPMTHKEFVEQLNKGAENQAEETKRLLMDNLYEAYLDYCIRDMD
uniref:CopG family transcriptional regulator n=1 Tax=Caenorhabditis tropicalis TaxID=1561998 RepID=A0A1I7SYJ6_9PELO